MHWVDDYIGLPFERDGRTPTGCDCWGLVRIVYRDQLNIDLPDFAGALGKNGAAEMRRMHDAIKAESKRWLPVEIPQPFDLALFNRAGINSHVGIVIDGHDMLHIASGIDSTIDAFSGLQYGRKLTGFFRYAR